MTMTEHQEQAALRVHKGADMKFVIPVTPTAQARARHARTKSGRNITYKSDDQVANERSLEACLMPHRPKNPLAGPLALEFVAALPVNRSDSKRAAQAKLSGKIAPVKKPDLDNLAKQLKDAMTRMGFWQDDCQIVCLRCSKIYAEVGYWSVAVYEAVRTT